MWRKGNPPLILMGMQGGTATLKNSVEVPQDVKNRATLRSSNCTTRYLSQRHRCSEKKRHMHPIAAMSTIAKLEGAEMPFNKWMDKEDVVHIYNGILLSHQKGWIPNICIDMDGTGGDYAKWNKSSREKQLSYGFSHMWNIRNRKISRRRKGRRKGG